MGRSTFFLTHSHAGEGEQGSLSSYRFAGPTVGDHVLTTDPLTVAAMQQIVMLDERHPSDVVFLPDVNPLDSGYVDAVLRLSPPNGCSPWPPTPWNSATKQC